eukprot:352526-Chlamydomonas_euryale.AAC.9
MRGLGAMGGCLVVVSKKVRGLGACRSEGGLWAVESDGKGSVRVDPRVVVIERCNLRHLSPEQLGGTKVDIACLDLSFISVLKVLPAVMGVLRCTANGRS